MTRKQSNNNILVTRCLAIHTDRSYYETENQKLLHNTKNKKKTQVCFGNSKDQFQKERTGEKSVLIRESRNLESLFTVFIPEIKSTIRSSSCKSVMYLNAKTQTKLDYIKEYQIHNQKINLSNLGIIWCTTGWKFKELTEYISLFSLWHLKVKFLFCCASSR